MSCVSVCLSVWVCLSVTTLAATSFGFTLKSYSRSQKNICKKQVNGYTKTLFTRLSVFVLLPFTRSVYLFFPFTRLSIYPFYRLPVLSVQASLYMYNVHVHCIILGECLAFLASGSDPTIYS